MSETKTVTLTTARRRRGVVRASVTRTEEHVAILKVKQDLWHADQPAIQHVLKKLEELDAEFKKYHYAIVEFLESEEDVEDEQAMMDDHDDETADVVNHLQVLDTKNADHSRVESAMSTPALGRQLNCIKHESLGHGRLWVQYNWDWM